MNSPLQTVILAGGGGTRFWPASTPACPKQFLRLLGDTSLLRQTADRMLPLSESDGLWVVTAEQYAGACRDALPEMPAAQCIAEPMGRNTGPAVAWAAFRIREALGPDALMVVAPADHAVGAPDVFRDAVQRASARAREADEIVLLGIQPTRPDTGYGYIAVGDAIAEGICRSRGFREKPDVATAEGYLRDGGYAWNAGLFVMRAGVFLAELARQCPDIHQALESACADGEIEACYAGLRNVSVDVGVMEGARSLSVVPVACAWSDVGGWHALDEVLPADADGNRAIGEQLTLDARGNTTYARGDHVVALLGVEDLVVVHTPHATLVMPKSHSQRVRDIQRIAQPDTRKTPS